MEVKGRRPIGLGCDRPRQDTQIFYIAPSDFEPYGSKI
jgi:hypothetical protein